MTEYAPDRPPLVVGAGLSLGYAQGVAEDRARALGARALVDPHAKWRADPATPKQLATLRRFRVKVAPGLTKGEASDLLSAALDRRGVA